jgi:hypothetical protein
MHIGDAQKIDKSGRTSQQATRNVLSCGSASQRPQGILLNLDSPANPTARLVGELKSCSSRAQVESLRGMRSLFRFSCGYHIVAENS